MWDSILSTLLRTSTLATRHLPSSYYGCLVRRYFWAGSGRTTSANLTHHFLCSCPARNARTKTNVALHVGLKLWLAFGVAVEKHNMYRRRICSLQSSKPFRQSARYRYQYPITANIHVPTPTRSNRSIHSIHSNHSIHLSHPN